MTDPKWAVQSGRNFVPLRLFATARSDAVQHHDRKPAYHTRIGKRVHNARLWRRGTVECQGPRGRPAPKKQLHDIIQAAHDTFTQGGTDPADDDVISVLMAKILEGALT